ncbi:MAG: TlyA family RNA methyltransferase [Eubacteriales bacterium]|nr:TlyA family RNA methyltransferase [Eubacteriales bacterium]MDD4584131.1 TlyA family RNA methyltransferase [Eubacteriales bacterium]
MKERLDVLLVQKGYYPSREKAKVAIMAGLVYINRQISDKPGMTVKTDSTIHIQENPCPYVGRGGLKLEKALKEFDINPENKVVADIGASTGGFTDCMLQKGASRVYAIDVGYGQLDYKLRIDPRVINMEKTNIRHLDPSTIPELLDIITIDVSFISLNLVFPVAQKILKENGKVIALIKPQFEAGREQVGKHGVIKDKIIHNQVILKVADYGKQNGLNTMGLTYSPLTGAKGNIEYLMFFLKGESILTKELDTSTIVDQAHASLYS